MRTFPETGFSGVWSKQKILVGVGGGWLRKTILPLCIVYIIPQHSTLFASEIATTLFVFSTLCPRLFQPQFSGFASQRACFPRQQGSIELPFTTTGGFIYKVIQKEWIGRHVAHFIWQHCLLNPALLHSSMSSAPVVQLKQGLQKPRKAGLQNSSLIPLFYILLFKC